MIYVYILSVLVVASLCWVLYKSKFLGFHRRSEKDRLYIRRKIKPVYREYRDYDELGEHVELPKFKKSKSKK